MSKSIHEAISDSQVVSDLLNLKCHFELKQIHVKIEWIKLYIS